MVGTTIEKKKESFTDLDFADDVVLLAEMGRLKMREWKNRHGRKCRGGKGGSGNIGTILQG